MASDASNRTVVTALSANVAVGLAKFVAAAITGSASMLVEGGKRGWLVFIRRTRNPELPVVLLEDSGALLGLLFALIGVVLSVVTGNGVFDGLTTVCIGLLLIATATALATETKSLIIGESALPEQLAAIEQALLASPGVDRVIIFGPCIWPGRVAARREARGRCQRCGRRHRRHDRRRRSAGPTAAPATKVIYLEPDIDHHAG